MIFNCPHCREPIEVHSGIQPPPESVWMSLTNKPVSLGCGSLLAIAIIVAICSGTSTRGVSEVRGDIRSLDEKIENLERMVRQLEQRETAGQPVTDGSESSEEPRAESR